MHNILYDCTTLDTFEIDLDSITSSLIFAYLSHTQQQQDQGQKKLYIPLVKVPKQDLELRPEMKYVLGEVGIDYQKLVTLDKIEDIIAQPTDIVLVDHNQLTIPFTGQEWADHVVGVLDHHVDEKFYLNAPIRHIEMVGSCVTLVLNHFDVLKSSQWLTEEIARLAMAPLLVDTVNLKWDLGRTTELDVQVSKVLENKLNHDQVQLNTYFKSIETVKSQVDNMSNYDILRRDYKEFSNVNGYRIGTSAVTWNLRAWLKREGGNTNVITDSVSKYAEEKDLDLEVVFTAFDYDKEGKYGGDYRRELAIFIINKELNFLKKALEENKDLQLKPIQEFNDSSNEQTEFYQQENVKMSRKQGWPLLKHLIEAAPAPALTAPADVGTQKAKEEQGEEDKKSNL